MSKAASWLFLATLFVITFEKVHWEVAGTVNLADVVSVLFLLSLDGVAVGAGTSGRVPRSGSCAAFGARLPRRATWSASTTRHGQASRNSSRGRSSGRSTSSSSSSGWRTCPALARYYWQAIAAFVSDGRQRGLRRAAARVRRDGATSTRGALADHRRGQLDQHLRRGRGAERVPAERADRRPEPPRRDADRAAARADAAVPAPRAPPPAARAARDPARVPARHGAGDAVAQRRCSGSPSGCSCWRCRTATTS